MHPTLEKYRAAWEDRDPALLKTIFTPHAVYQFRPWEAARGLAEIEKYWLEKVVTQTDVCFEVTRELLVGNELWIEWTAHARLADRNTLRALWGTMILELANDNRISKLTEYYFKTEKPC